MDSKLACWKVWAVIRDGSQKLHCIKALHQGNQSKKYLAGLFTNELTIIAGYIYDYF